MLGFKLISIVLAMAVYHGICAPATPAVSRSRKVTKSVTKRQDAVDVGEFILEIADDIIGIVSDIDDAQHEQEIQFTQQTVSNLQAQFPTSNILMYHDQDCGYDLTNGVHEHVELDLTDSLGTMGYEIWVFDYGTFELVGDGGYENWAISGNFVRDGNYVTFNSIS